MVGTRLSESFPDDPRLSLSVVCLICGSPSLPFSLALERERERAKPSLSAADRRRSFRDLLVFFSLVDVRGPVTP